MTTKDPVTVIGPEECIEQAIVGSKITAECLIDTHDGRDVQLHCVEVLYDTTIPTKLAVSKRFAAFSHGVEIRELVAVRDAQGKWVPK